MAVAITTNVWAERRGRVAELRIRQGFVRQLLDFYGALLNVQEKAAADAKSASPAPPDIPAFIAEVVAPGVIDVSVATGPERLRSELIHRLQAEHPRNMVERWINGVEQPMVDRFFARACLEPVLEALETPARAACLGVRDARHCPECEGPPQLSYFAPAKEDLAAGPRMLLCARCASTWTYPRMTCAGCGESSTAKLPIFSEHGTTSGERGSVVRGVPGTAPPVRHPAVFPHIRIDACETCKRYLLNIDLATEPRAVPVVDEMAAIPLDLYARERGFTKITTNLMGF
ncbi:MAG TPA: formate dehydrogenase accessory protein FdhE [Candidatus Dormibacteraeota bacterium]|nr:formate dehydrogenase accessory protein FdhE [Candidatus Dormibacteraeota bacterium]